MAEALLCLLPACPCLPRRLGWALRSTVRAQRLLALTATATKATEAAVLGVLGIPPAAVLRDSVVRNNLRLHVVRKAGGEWPGVGLRLGFANWLEQR